MSQTAQKQPEAKKLPEITGRVCNDLLLCVKIEMEDKIGSIYVTSGDGASDLRDSIGKKAQIILASPKLSPQYDEYKRGEIIFYAKGTKEYDIWIDGDRYFFIHKNAVVYAEGD